MCARLLACPLCAQPGFLTLDALRAGLVSVATRPLACPVCNEVLLGIDKLTIHLFGHTITQGNQPVGGGNESAKLIKVTSNNNGNVQTIMRNAQTIPIQQWNVLNTAQTVDTNNKRLDDNNGDNAGSGIYIPIDDIDTFRNLTTIKDVNNAIPVNSTQNVSSEMKAQSQVIFLQNVSSQPKIYTTNIINQSTVEQESLASGIYQTISTVTPTSETTEMDQMCRQEINDTEIHPNEPNIMITVKNISENPGKESYTQTTPRPNWGDDSNVDESSSASQYPLSHTDRLAELVKNAQITSSPLGSFHESFDCSKPPSPVDTTISTTTTTSTSSVKPSIKSQRILPANERTERCNICGFHFPDRNILILHKQLVHLIKDKDSNIALEDLMKNYPCHLCTKVFKMRGSLMVHMRVAHPGINNCPNNRLKVLENVKLPEHLIEPLNEPESSHDNETESNYSCPICGKIFKKEQLVTQHIKIHDGKQWECDICSKMFTTKYFLKKHKRLHSGEMPYRCNLCDKTFTFQQSFHKHRLYHKDDKPHTCNTCGRSFKELSTLHNHERIHTGEKPFACESCGKCFRQRVSYLVHRRIHTGVMPYKCASCGKTFRYKVSQRTHKCPPPSGSEPSDNVQETSDRNEMHESSSQDEQSMDTPSEENEYVLVMNEKGRHVLKRKIDFEKTKQQNVNEKSPAKNKEDTNESNEFMQSMWNHETANDMEYKENKIDDVTNNVIKDTNLWNGSSNNKNDSPISDDSISKTFNIKEAHNELNGIWNRTPSREIAFDKVCDKSPSNNTADFFSMIMSPMANETSPSTEMEHLRLSSPTNNQENSCEATDCFPPMNNNVNAVQVNHNNMQENFSENNVNLSTLQTINEDSLKELLNSIADK